MKINYLVILVLTFPFILACSSKSNAQIVSNYGVKIGITSSKAVDVNVKDFYWGLYKSSRISGSYSIFGQFLNSSYYRFEFELGYRVEGAEDKIPITTSENPDGTGEFVILDHAYDFISMNISFQPKIETEGICFYGIISPSLSIMIKNRDQTILNKNIEKLVLGYALGFGFQPKNILTKNLFIEFRYNNFFSNVLKYDYIKAKFSSFQISLGSYL